LVRSWRSSISTSGVYFTLGYLVEHFVFEKLEAGWGIVVLWALRILLDLSLVATVAAVVAEDIIAIVKRIKKQIKE